MLADRALDWDWEGGRVLFARGREDSGRVIK